MNVLSLDLHTVNNEVANYSRPHHSRVNNAIVVTPCRAYGQSLEPAVEPYLSQPLARTYAFCKAQTVSVRPLFLSDIK